MLSRASPGGVDRAPDDAGRAGTIEKAMTTNGFSSFETGQMSAVETGQMSAAETRQISTRSLLFREQSPVSI